MKLVIDIQDSLYENIMICWENIHPKVWEILKNGTPLPKGHGRLIDEKALSSEIFLKADMLNSHTCYNSIIGLLCDAPTIVEADREVGNGKTDN